MNGVLVIDKPTGMTSHDVVNQIRRITGERSVGHLGTLDPLATGVLPLLLGNLTRLSQFYTNAEKEYEGEIRFGFATDTYDAEGEPTTSAVPLKATLEDLRHATMRFRGTIQQLPPPFSSKKVGGVPAHKLARKGREVPLEPVSVEVTQFEILSLDGDRAHFRARVSAGTYMRSVAHDLGRELGVGAHLAGLRRTSSGEFSLADAHRLEEVAARAEGGRERLQGLFLHPRRILPQFPSVTATDDAVARIRHGQAVNLQELSRARYVKVFRGQAELIAIAMRLAGTLFHPKVVLQGIAKPTVTATNRE